MKRSILVSLVVICCLAGSSFAAPSASLKRAKQLLNEANAIALGDPAVAEAPYKAAFHEAMQLTNPKFKGKYREASLFLATQCLHPSLFVELRIAIETYLSIYPKGAHRAEVFIQKALLEYSEGKVPEAEASLQEAAKIAKSKSLQQRIKSLQFDGYMQTNKYRTAEKFLNEVGGKKPSSRTKKELKRFKSGNEQMNTVAATVKTGTVPEADTLRKHLEKGYFTAPAPALDLMAQVREDSGEPLLHGVEITFMGKTCASLHRYPSFIRIEQLKRFLEKYPEADQEILGLAVREIYSIYLHELNDEEQANLWLGKLAKVPSFTHRAAVERNLALIQRETIDSPKVEEYLKEISSFTITFPYDNGWYPTIDRPFLNEITAFNLLLNKKLNQLKQLLKVADFTGTIRTIPVKLLLLVVTDQKAAAYAEFKKAEASLSPRDKKFMLDYLLPLWQFLNVTDQEVLTATIVSNRYPLTAVDVLLKTLTGFPSKEKLDHALALLADLYQKNRSYVEAQSVWNTLRTLYPKSVWVR